MHPPYFPNGQDANHLPFPQAVSPYFVPNYDAETKLNDDMDVGSFSGDDDVEEYDSNAQLRSQQLNSDGTPKRPMNAFMIFARKRRPMVSSEQPTMRTGEISKILSKEWSEMNKEEKKFYLDQAKKLKDTFNTRWPDYVYRRRPNNSRKRRKAGGTSSVGPARSHDAGNNSDSHADPTDLNASGQSGDEARSHSTDAFPSPPSSHHNHTYHTPEIGQPVSLDRSPTLANTLSAYTTTLPPYIPHSFADGSVFDKFSQQGHSYGGNGDVYYGAPVPIEASFSTIHHNPKMESWRPCESTPSGVVATTSSTTPPVPMTAITSQELHPRLAYQPHDQGNWSKEAGGDAQCYEAQPTIWGSNSSVPAHHAVDDRGSTHSFFRRSICLDLTRLAWTRMAITRANSRKTLASQRISKPIIPTKDITLLLLCPHSGMNFPSPMTPRLSSNLATGRSGSKTADYILFTREWSNQLLPYASF
ncbi:HMG-box domain [Rhizoctonia solani]|uniref:HMG-box domain n=1 Tax=Rhizoctonia solani TaxID=456999 RepID=A0A8H7ICU3_9AGAM|nr:HMG-box domain [Rhizoctonia solani]